LDDFSPPKTNMSELAGKFGHAICFPRINKKETAMKKLKILAILFTALFVLTACDDWSTTPLDTTPPEPPQNLQVFAYDETVELYWLPNRESDLNHYNVYVSDAYDGVYAIVASTHDTFFRDDNVVNGQIYYYAVTAVDNNNNESELSYDEAFAIPRPEGFNNVIYNYLTNPDESGYSFALENTVRFNSIDADFFFEYSDGQFYIDVWSDADILDAGETTSIYDVRVAPATGWVPLNEGDNIKYVQAIPGHTYVIWTADNHFGKIRVSALATDRMTFDWAYQLIEGETSLKKIARKRIEKKNIEISR
jgi:hypothetical protein